MKPQRIIVLKVNGLRKKSRHDCPIEGFSDNETVMLDFDCTPFDVVKYWAFRAVRFHKLGGFLILKSSKNSYHVVFNRPVSWSENTRIIAWVSLESGNENLKKYFLMQCIKESSTLRISNKGEKSSPRIVFRFRKQDKQVKEYLSYRRMIKRTIRQIRNKKAENQQQI